MQVVELMSRDVATCAPDTTLARAAWAMWERDCGILVVVADQKAVGVVTDRDIAMALATKPRPAHEIPVAEVLGSELYSVRPGDDIARALELLAEKQLRRLPVLDGEGRVQGLLSLSDLIQATHKVQGETEEDLSFMDVVGVLKAVTRRRTPQRASRESSGESRAPARASRRRASAGGA